MGDVRAGDGLALELLGEALDALRLCVEDLDGHVLAHVEVLAEEHGPHATGGDGRVDAITSGDDAADERLLPRVHARRSSFFGHEASTSSRKFVACSRVTPPGGAHGAPSTRSLCPDPCRCSVSMARHLRRDSATSRGNTRTTALFEDLSSLCRATRDRALRARAPLRVAAST